MLPGAVIAGGISGCLRRRGRWLADPPLLAALAVASPQSPEAARPSTRTRIRALRHRKALLPLAITVLHSSGAWRSLETQRLSSLGQYLPSFRRNAVSVNIHGGTHDLIGYSARLGRLLTLTPQRVKAANRPRPEGIGDISRRAAWLAREPTLRAAKRPQTAGLPPISRATANENFRVMARRARGHLTTVRVRAARRLRQQRLGHPGQRRRA